MVRRLFASALVCALVLPFVLTAPASQAGGIKPPTTYNYYVVVTDGNNYLGFNANVIPTVWAYNTTQGWYTVSNTGSGIYPFFGVSYGQLRKITVTSGGLASGTYIPLNGAGTIYQLSVERATSVAQDQDGSFALPSGSSTESWSFSNDGVTALLNYNP